MRNKMKNAHKDWTPSEVEELKRLVLENFSKIEIAVKLGRTPVAIESKARLESISFMRPHLQQNRQLPRS
jgi:hypothetical protein